MSLQEKLWHYVDNRGTSVIHCSPVALGGELGYTASLLICKRALLAWDQSVLQDSSLTCKAVCPGNTRIIPVSTLSRFAMLADFRSGFYSVQGTVKAGPVTAQLFYFYPVFWATGTQLCTEACFAGYWELGKGGRTVHTVQKSLFSIKIIFHWITSTNSKRFYVIKYYKITRMYELWWCTFTNSRASQTTVNLSNMTLKDRLNELYIY